MNTTVTVLQKTEPLEIRMERSWAYQTDKLVWQFMEKNVEGLLVALCGLQLMEENWQQKRFLYIGMEIEITYPMIISKFYKEKNIFPDVNGRRFESLTKRNREKY